MMPTLRPRRRATVSATNPDTFVDEGNVAAGRTSPDSEEVRQSAAVLEMMASKSQSRPNEDEEDNVKLSAIIASVIEKHQPETSPKPSTRPKRQAARKTPVAIKEPRSEVPLRRSRRRISQPQSEPQLRRSRRRAKISVEVTVTTSDEEEGADEAEAAADFCARQTSTDMLDESDAAAGYDAPAYAFGSSSLPTPAPKFYEMTPQLLESLMAPVGLFQSPSEDGTEKELRLRMPVDYGGGCVGVCDILFNEHLGVRIDGATDWMPVHFIGDYLDPESVQVPDTVFTEVDESLMYGQTRNGRSGGRYGAREASSSQNVGPHPSLGCKEEVHRIAAVLEMNSWMGSVVKAAASSDWLLEHDYAEPMIKFGRPRSANILQDAISAFNKYVNFIRLSERREPFLFGLWWEKEDMHADYWLLPKPKEEDADYDRRQAMMIIPIANEWTEEVVVSSEETVDLNGVTGAVTPMTFWDNRGFLSLTSLNGPDGDYSSAEASFNSTVAAEETFFKRPDGSSSSKPRKRTTATPVARAPRFLAPKLDPSVALLTDGKFNENGMPDNLDEIVNSIHNQAHLYDPGNGSGAAGSSGGYSNRNRSTATATGSHLKNLSKEKLDEIDFAMRCIKELQQRRYAGPCRLHCKICSREFTAPTSLIVHYRSHAGIKPFTCPICLTSFTRRHSLKYHMLCHSGQARFRCNMCDRLFRHSGHYRDHMRKHEHGMPFSCTECNRVFATRTTYRRHMSVVHNSTETQKGKGRSVGVSKLYAEMEGIDELEAGELGEVAEEIEYEGEDDEDMDSFAAEEVVEG